MQRARASELAVLTALSLGLAPVAAVQNPEDFPNLLAGTFTDGQRFSTGNTLPLIARPWGFNHWSVQTNDGKSSWWFRGDDPHFRWLRLTHQPSPWIGDWAWVLFGPQMGEISSDPMMFFEPWGSRFRPYGLDAMLGPDNMRVRLTPTDHGAVLKVTFPAVNPNNYAKRICFRLPPTTPGGKDGAPSEWGELNLAGASLELISRRGADVPKNFGLHVRAEVDASSLLERPELRVALHDMNRMACFSLSPREVDVTVSLGTSLISREQAMLNLQREVRGRRFSDVEEESRQVWRRMLSRVDVSNPGPISEQSLRRLTIFYSGLYRTLLFPRKLDEIDANGKRVHYSPYDPLGGVHEGFLVTDNGFWDTFRTVYPLLNLAYPKEAGEIVSGWLNAYKEGGWLPEWSSPGYRECMVGTFADVVVVDAVLKKIPGFDENLAWQAVQKDSFEPGPKRSRVKAGKKEYNEYDSLGYIPAELNADSVSGSLDYAFSDFSVALLADKLGKTSDASALRHRAAKALKNLFHHQSGLMRPKSGDGVFRTGEAHKWGGGYTEGSAWHHSFPPFDLKSLIELHGSREAVTNKIQELCEAPGTFMAGTYGRVIHEMEEMRALGMGQYGHNNQPVHHILFMLIALDGARPECNASRFVSAGSAPGRECARYVGETKLHEVRERAYSTSFYAGDEDNGEMGAWYVLSALGLFDVAPGTNAGYTLGTPLFPRVDIYRDSDGSARPALTITCPQAGGADAVHVSRVLLDGQDVSAVAANRASSWALPHDVLFRHGGAELQFVGAGQDAAPPAGPPASAALQSAGKPSATAPGLSAPFAPGSGARAAANSAEEHRLREEVRSIQQRMAEQQDELARLRSSARRSGEASAATHGSESLIASLKNQLHEHREEHDMDEFLITHVRLVAIIFLVINVLGWMACICSRGGSGPCGGGRGAGESGRSKRSRRVNGTVQPV
eukprot:TRINITY_DN5022_c0_g2_i1.p1 TRINITY_DN5022_c0_g2~~TRINITY_DN5022_c0_g2_i1.p1  ORF type:complete len:1010 (-),score=189.35 TRINITY_DN5022_c0_g2_i1:33-2903(-)